MVKDGVPNNDTEQQRVTPYSNSSGIGQQKKRIWLSEENIIVLILCVIFVFMAILSPQFRTRYNIFGFLRHSSLIAIVAIGQTVVLVSGGFDLSVGSIAAIVGMLTGHLLVTFQMPVWSSILCGISLGLVCGAFNGVLISKAKINPLIATLASSWIFNGIILVTTQGWPVVDLPATFIKISKGGIFGIPNLVLIMIALAIIVSFYLSSTYWGRFIYAIGGNEQAAILTGINADAMKISCYCFSGAFAGVAGILLASRVATASPEGGMNWALPSIAAAVIGGVAIGGGKGKIYGVIAGAILFSLINNALVLSRVSSYWQSLVTGVILVLAVLADSFRRK